MDVNAQVDPEPYQPYSGRISFKGFALRVGIVLFGWFVTAFTGMAFTLLLDEIGGAEHDFDRITKVTGVAALMVIIGVYRVAARKFKFRKPSRVVRVALNITWVVLTFFAVGGTVEIAVGHPNIAAGISGIVAAVLVCMLVSRKPETIPVTQV